MKVLIVGDSKDHRRLSSMLKMLESTDAEPMALITLDELDKHPPMEFVIKASPEIPMIDLPVRTSKGKRKRGRDFHRHR